MPNPPGVGSVSATGVTDESDVLLSALLVDGMDMKLDGEVVVEIGLRDGEAGVCAVPVDPMGTLLFPGIANGGSGEGVAAELEGGCATLLAEDEVKPGKPQSS